MEGYLPLLDVSYIAKVSVYLKSRLLCHKILTLMQPILRFWDIMAKPTY